MSVGCARTYLVCMYILISYSLADSNNLERDRALLQYQGFFYKGGRGGIAPP